jgi:hypothetical protein
VVRLLLSYEASTNRYFWKTVQDIDLR